MSWLENLRCKLRDLPRCWCRDVPWWWFGSSHCNRRYSWLASSWRSWDDPTSWRKSRTVCPNRWRSRPRLPDRWRRRCTTASRMAGWILKKNFNFLIFGFILKMNKFNVSFCRFYRTHYNCKKNNYVLFISVLIECIFDSFVSEFVSFYLRQDQRKKWRF